MVHWTTGLDCHYVSRARWSSNRCQPSREVGEGNSPLAVSERVQGLPVVLQTHTKTHTQAEWCGRMFASKWVSTRVVADLRWWCWETVLCWGSHLLCGRRTSLLENHSCVITSSWWCSRWGAKENWERCLTLILRKCAISIPLCTV